MRVLLRADASISQGSGHVMRVLTLSEELATAGHEIHLASAPSGIPWLEDLIAQHGLVRHLVEPHTLGADLLHELRPDWLVVDSYEIPAELITQNGRGTKVLAIIDGDSRDIEADLYLDHNLGAENLPWPPRVAERILAGSTYALVRRAVCAVRRNDPWDVKATLPRVLAFMGGTDPTGMIVRVAEALAASTYPLEGTVVCAPAWRETVNRLLADHPNIAVVPPTNDLPALLAETDIAISAAGTSSWELCTLGIPSILVEVVENQTESLREMTQRGLVIGLSPREVSEEDFRVSLLENIELLANNASLRKNLSEACAATFDGKGPERVVAVMTAASSGSNERG